ncbi:MAG: phage tail protein [Gammaproteobacteria bacterium]|nr:phage tail protein [Gammaproteobacteria bacterium]
MKYFKDEAGTIYAYEDDGSQDELIGDKTPLTVEQVDALLNPPPTPAQSVAQAEQQKAALKATADAEIEWRQYAVSKGIATNEESAALDEWSLYRVRLMRIDTSKAPNIEWPALPV